MSHNHGDHIGYRSQRGILAIEEILLLSVHLLDVSIEQPRVATKGGENQKPTGPRAFMQLASRGKITQNQSSESKSISKGRWQTKGQGERFPHPSSEPKSISEGRWQTKPD